MQEPNAIHLPSQVTAPTACILSIGGGFPASQLGGVVDQEAGAGVGTMVTSEGAQGIGNRALFLTDVLLEVAQFPEAVHDYQAGLNHLNKGMEVEK
jgi:hypothetical protein